MQDKTSLGISDTFREFIEALVEEVVINGEPFDAQKKWLRKHSEREGISYETIESNLDDLFEAIKELEEHESKSTERFARNLAQSCYFSETEVDKLINNAVRVRNEADRIAAEQKAARIAAEKEAERIAREERNRKAREKQEEEEYWNRFSGSKSGCQFYLNRYPYGKYTSMARSAIADYEKKEKEGEQKEQLTWNSCRTKADFQQYLNQYPQGMYASQAYIKMLEAEKEEDNRNQHLLRIENGAVSCKDDSIEGSLVIPFKINGQHVTAIGEDAFAYCGNLTSVVIPDGVTKIGRSAFYFCTNLTSIVIPDSVTEIGYFALRSCDNLRRIVIKDASLLEKAFAPKGARIEKP